MSVKGQDMELREHDIHSVPCNALGSPVYAVLFNPKIVLQNG